MRGKEKGENRKRKIREWVRKGPERGNKGRCEGKQGETRGETDKGIGSF